MMNTLVPIRQQINSPGDFGYFQPRTNFYPAIREIEKPLVVTLEMVPRDEHEDNLPAITRIADLPVASEITSGGYESLLPIRGTLKNLQYA